MMAYRIQKLLFSRRRYRTQKIGAFYLNSLLYHCSEESHQAALPSQWYEQVISKITRLTQLLNTVDSINGRLVDISTNSTIVDDDIEHKMLNLKSLVRAFIGSPLVQQRVKSVLASSTVIHNDSFAPFSKANERQPMVVDSLTKVSNFLNVTAQQRKLVRITVSPQVTQHRIWTGALEEVLDGLKYDLDSLISRGLAKDTKMSQQIVYSCLKFLTETANSCDSTSWMRIGPSKNVDSSDPKKWEDLLEMFNDLIQCLRSEMVFKLHVDKLEVLKEGLSHIKDVLVDNRIGYKETRHQESLVQKKLTKTLGHSSRCLFTLLLYYLYRTVYDIEVDVSGGIYRIDGDNRFCLYMGRILTSDDEKMVGRGVKQLDRVLGLFKFVWETAGIKGHLEPQGHIWCAGANSGMLEYRGNKYFVHGICL